MKVLVILTGGTIGSESVDHILNINKTTHLSLINLYEARFGKEAEFEIQNPFTILSENILPKNWEMLCNVLHNVNQKEYDGIIITHGSDTLPYTSALIGLLFGHSSIPILLVASNYELNHPLSNGLENFHNAISVIREGTLKGVFTIFQNHKQENIVYLPTRIQEADCYGDQFSSFGGIDFGRVQNDKFSWNDCALNPSIQELNHSKTIKIKTNINFINQVLVITPYPGFDYHTVNLTKDIKVILHSTYHSATTCTEGENTSVLLFMKKCKEQNIDLYMSSCKENAVAMYDSSSKIIKNGGIPLVNISREAAYVKLLIAYNQKNMKAKDYMKENIYYESVVNKSVK